MVLLVFDVLGYCGTGLGTVCTSTYVFTKTIVEKSGENIHLFSLCMHVFGWLLVKIRVRLESRGASVSAFTENRCHMSPD